MLNVHAMKPGPKLDMLIAEKVMEWAPHFRNSAFYVDADKADKIMDHSYCSVSAFCPSTEIDDAWKVIDALQEAEYWVRVIAGRDGAWKKSATVEVGKLPDTNGNPSRQIASLSGLPVPEMICKMALAAVTAL